MTYFYKSLIMLKTSQNLNLTLDICFTWGNDKAKFRRKTRVLMFSKIESQVCFGDTIPKYDSHSRRKHVTLKPWR